MPPTLQQPSHRLPRCALLSMLLALPSLVPGFWLFRLIMLPLPPLLALGVIVLCLHLALLATLLAVDALTEQPRILALPISIVGFSIGFVGFLCDLFLLFIGVTTGFVP